MSLTMFSATSAKVQVVASVIGLVEVNVMDLLPRREGAPESLRNHPSVLMNPSQFAPDFDADSDVAPIGKSGPRLPLAPLEDDTELAGASINGRRRTAQEFRNCRPRQLTLT